MKGGMKVLGPAAVVVALVAAPFIATSYVISLATGVLVLGLLTMSVNLLTGVAGLPTLGQAAYFGVGAYAAALVARSWSQVGVVHLLVAAAAGAAVAALTGLVVVRTRGVVFLMLTLAINELTYSAVLEWDAVTGGSFDRSPDAQVQAAELAVERAKRAVERGRHAAVVIDTLEALPPGAQRRLFGAGRATEEGGTLTVVASIGELREPLRWATTRVLLEPPESPSGTLRSELLG